jgi:hypothetical protein
MVSLSRCQVAKQCAEIHIVAFDVDRMHGRYNLAPGESHFGVLLDYLAETEVRSQAEQDRSD